MGVVRWEKEIRAAAARHNVPADLIRAIMCAESNGDPLAFRDEPRIGDASYGLMQVLLSTARDRGFTGTIDELMVPAVNVDIGARHLRYLLNRYPTVADTIAAYNAGSPERGAKIASTRAYVKRVLGYMGRGGGLNLGALIALLGGLFLWHKWKL